MNEYGLKKILLFTGILFLIFFTLVPIIWMFLVSFAGDPWFLVSGRSFRLSLKAWSDVLTSSSLQFPFYLRNSVLISLLTSFFGTLIGSMGAYGLARFKIRGKALIIMVILGLSMFPQISIVGYLFRVMSSLRLINTYPALLLPYLAWNLPLALWLLTGYFSAIPREIEQAAEIDGADRKQIFSRILFPLALPGILSTMLLLFMYSFNEFLFALLLTSDPSVQTVPVGIAYFQGLHGELPWSQIMAASSLATLPVIILAFIFQKYIISGMTRGAVK